MAKWSTKENATTLENFKVQGHEDGGPSYNAPIALFDARYQQAAAVLSELVALADAAGVLTNDGAGNLSWGAGGGGGGSVAWDDVTGKPSTFPPATHTHAIADTTGLQTALDGKASTSHTHAWADLTSKPANLSTFGGLADAAGVLRNDGAGIFDYLAVSAGGNGSDDLNKLVAYNGAGGLTASYSLDLVSTGEGVFSVKAPDAVSGSYDINLPQANATLAASPNADGSLSIFDLWDIPADAAGVLTSDGAGTLTFETPAAADPVGWADITDKPSTFTPSSHTHAIGDITGTLPISQGGTGQTDAANAFNALAPTTAKGDVIVNNGTNNVRLAVGTNGQVITADSTAAEGVKWADPAAGSATTNNQLFTADATWTNPSPSTPKRVFVRLVGGGGGGGSGRKGAAGTVRCGGGGGAAGAIVEFWTLTTELGGTESVVIGANGTGGASQATNSSNGNAGTLGGTTTFAGMSAQGGGGGGGGTNAAGTAGTNSANANAIGIASGNVGAAGAASGTGSAGGSGSTVVFSAPTSGGAGGGITTGNAASNGGTGGAMGNTPLGTLAGGTAGAWSATVAGGNGNAGRGSGTGGGGGASSNTTNAGAGGNGGGYGSGGGGGGASVDSTGDSGKGGDGAPGYALIITYL